MVVSLTRMDKMKTKLVKVSVRKSNNRVYFGRIVAVKNYNETWPCEWPIAGSNGCAPAQINTRQRYLKIEAIRYRG